VTRVGSVIERHGQIQLLGKRAEPFTVLIDEATKFPCRQFELDQSERRVTPSTNLNQPVDPDCLSDLIQHRNACAGIRDDIGDEVGGECRRKPKLLRQPVETSSCLGSDNMTPSDSINGLSDRSRKMGESS
jgi:hypothetical protein